MATEFLGSLYRALVSYASLLFHSASMLLTADSASPCIAPRSHHCPGQRTLSVRRRRNTKPAANIYRSYNSACQADASGLDREFHASRAELGGLPLMRQTSPNVHEDNFEADLVIITKNKGHCSDTIDRSRACIVACLINIKLMETDK